MLFTDIHVKHSTILSKFSITESAVKAIECGSDAIVVTGKWTGDAPVLNEVKKIKEIINEFPLLIGSGIDEKNINSLSRYANGAIVSTSLKTGKNNSSNVNIKGYDSRINRKAVKSLMSKIKYL